MGWASHGHPRAAGHRSVEEPTCFFAPPTSHTRVLLLSAALQGGVGGMPGHGDAPAMGASQTGFLSRQEGRMGAFGGKGRVD